MSKVQVVLEVETIFEDDHMAVEQVVRILSPYLDENFGGEVARAELVALQKLDEIDD
jgi:hypothetical protein